MYVHKSPVSYEEPYSVIPVLNQYVLWLWQSTKSAFLWLWGVTLLLEDYKSMSKELNSSRKSFGSVWNTLPSLFQTLQADRNRWAKWGLYFLKVWEIQKYWWKEFLSSSIPLYIQIVKQGYLNFLLCMEKHRGSLVDISILIWKYSLPGNMWESNCMKVCNLFLVNL